jgi:hypothetical protein
MALLCRSGWHIRTGSRVSGLWSDKHAGAVQAGLPISSSPQQASDGRMDNPVLLGDVTAVQQMRLPPASAAALEVINALLREQTTSGKTGFAPPQSLFYESGPGVETKRGGRSLVAARRVLLANELSGFSVPSSLLLIAGRKSWIELLRVLFLDCLIWHRLGVRAPRHSVDRFDGLTASLTTWPVLFARFV